MSRLNQDNNSWTLPAQSPEFFNPKVLKTCPKYSSSRLAMMPGNGPAGVAADLSQLRASQHQVGTRKSGSGLVFEFSLISARGESTDNASV